MTEPRGEELIKRYRANYGIAADAVVTEEMVLTHWELEKRLRDELLESTPENRWDVFERCYSKLYSDLDWLNQLGKTDAPRDTPEVIYGHWKHVVGSPPLRIYEVGSGKGQLIEYLAKSGFECKATEITRERGNKWVSPHPNLTWGVSDGIHLDQFEPAGCYDVVISNQVVEHMHPDDLLDHFKAVAAILSSQGRYIFSTPHAYTGPSDVSAVFQRDQPMGMHLKEYNYSELGSLLSQAGFQQVDAPLRFPKKVRKWSGEWLNPRSSRLYMTYLCNAEKTIARLPTQSARRKAAKALKLLLFASNIMVVASKPK